MSFIPWWVHYPNVNNEILNLDWLLKVSNCNTHKIENFINLNTIKYADPILWDITSQYEANTVVVDGQTGNAYISTKAVPSGVHLNRTEYWTQIYNYADELSKLRSQIARNEGATTTASRDYAIGDLVFVNDLLYRVTSPMIAGDSFVEDSNVELTTIEIEIHNEQRNRQFQDDRLQGLIDDEERNRQYQDDRLQTQITYINTVLRESNTTKNRRMLIISDSYGTLVDSDGVLLNVAIGSKCGVAADNIIDLHRSGIGFTNVNDRGTFLNLLMENESTIETPETITDIVVIGGANDYGMNINEITTAIQNFIAYCKTIYINAKISIGHVGTNRQNNGYLVKYTDYSIPAYRMCSRFGATYLHNSEYILHSSEVLNSDLVHPNTIGVDVLSNSIASCILNGSCDVWFKHTPELTLNTESLGNYTGFSFSYATPITVEIENNITNLSLHHGAKLLLTIADNTLSGSTKNMNVVLADLSVKDIVGDGIMNKSIQLPAKLEDSARQQLGTATAILYINANSQLALNIIYNNQETAIAHTTNIEIALAGGFTCTSQSC